MKSIEENLKKIEEIDKQIEVLKTERKKYDKQVKEYNKRKLLKERKAYEGKCFIASSDDIGFYDFENIKAFKILEIVDSYNYEFAKCFIIKENYDKNCYYSTSIEIKTMNTFLEIDGIIPLSYYSEIGENEFKKIVNKYLEEHITNYL